MHAHRRAGTLTMDAVLVTAATAASVQQQSRDWAIQQGRAKSTTSIYIASTRSARPHHARGACTNTYICVSVAAARPLGAVTRRRAAGTRRGRCACTDHNTYMCCALHAVPCCTMACALLYLSATLMMTTSALAMLMMMLHVEEGAD